ncbi:hypothetical protein UFOVP978_50 [uncultured Caudovirales phage]|uniref:Uncharacterized protein n=1 Tax=uncultured Caudovirales phage TaxID=2100421 RepID=A0A6J5QAK3_9CAUD|nr:hypothetical protein UFOVP978_50 [uncultured Caudovirales phage]
MSYDAWLEKPFQQAQDQSDRFEKWCEDNDQLIDDPDSVDLFVAAEEELEEGAEESRTESILDRFEAGD